MPSSLPLISENQVIDHYENPRNVGSMDKKDMNVGTGLVGAPACGDVMKLQVGFLFFLNKIFSIIPLPPKLQPPVPRSLFHCRLCSPGVVRCQLYIDTLLSCMLTSWSLFWVKNPQIYVDDDGNITDAKFKTFGCGSAIASSSLATEKIKGKSLYEAYKMKNTDIAKELALPPVKLHCSMLAEDAIHAAIKDYAKKTGKNLKSLTTDPTEESA